MSTIIKYYKTPVGGKSVARHRRDNGWSDERANEVVNLGRNENMNIGSSIDVPPMMEFVVAMKLSHFDGYNAMIECSCKCGHKFTVEKGHLYWDSNCGCAPCGHTPERVALIKEMEKDEDFREYCRKYEFQSTVTTYKTYLARKASYDEATLHRDAWECNIHKGLYDTKETKATNHIKLGNI